MGREIYLNAVKEAKEELEVLKKEHLNVLRKIEALENFIQSGLALAREIADSGRDLTQPPPEQSAPRTVEASSFKSPWPPEE